MFWKFKVEKPSYVLYKRVARHFEAEKLSNILSFPIIESYEQQSRLMRAEIEQLKAMKSIGQGIIQSHVTELRLARTEAFQLRQEVQLLKTRWHVVVCKYIPWKAGSSSTWPEKPSGSWRGLQGCLKGKRLLSTFEMQQKIYYLQNSNQVRYVSVTSDYIFILLFYGSFKITYNFSNCLSIISTETSHYIIRKLNSTLAKNS